MKPEGVGGGGEGSRALSALKQIVQISSYLERLFHSVISYSVGCIHAGIKPVENI